MTTDTITAADLELRDAIINELDWDSQFDAGELAVSARAGAVTLTGSIDSYAGKLAAERAVKRLRGVRAVANDIRVTLLGERGDSEIAHDVARNLASRPTLPNTVQAVVHGGRVTLSGTCRTLFQRFVAERAVRHVKGIKDVTNRITVTRTALAPDLAQQIHAAVRRDVAIATSGIDVTVNDNAVVLRGRVSSWAAREAAEQVVMHLPGIAIVQNEIAVMRGEPDNVEQELC
jgi:osmotically-inducible protein OsmY